MGRRVMLARTWPLFLLLVYVVYPEIEPRWAWVAAAITVLVIVINFWLEVREWELVLVLGVVV